MLFLKLHLILRLIQAIQFWSGTPKVALPLSQIVQSLSKHNGIPVKDGTRKVQTIYYTWIRKTKARVCFKYEAGVGAERTLATDSSSNNLHISEMTHYRLTHFNIVHFGIVCFVVCANNLVSSSTRQNSTRLPLLQKYKQLKTRVYICAIACVQWYIWISSLACNKGWSLCVLWCLKVIKNKDTSLNICRIKIC